VEACGPTGRTALIATVRIDAIAAGGDGVGRHDGLVVFIPRTAPGDLVRADVEPRGRFARVLPLEIVAPSPDRVDPACTHYTRDACGGCQIQHLAYGAQLAAKQRIVRDAIERIGKREATLSFIRESPDQWRYRSKLTLAMRRRGERWIAGLHRFDEPTRIFALSDCPITRREIVHAWRDVLTASEHLPDERQLRGSVRQTANGLAFTLLGGRRWSAHAAFFERVPVLSAVWWKPEGGAARCLHARRDQDAAGEAAEAGAAFAQVNPAVALELHRHVIERARAHSPSHVLDAYAGAGHTAMPLAELGVRVDAVELDAHAAAVMARRLTAPSSVTVGRVEEHIAGLLPAEVVLLNPPRTGLAPQVTAALEQAAGSVRAVIYASCNPATLARDLARLSNFRIESLVLFDMFPQTGHVETVCELVPAA
jgi:23S rRNA (uracil1939-C5)-methyltransferase